jgi:hypothetical protein
MQDQDPIQQNESNKESSWPRFSIRPWTGKTPVSASYIPSGSFVTPTSTHEKTGTERQYTPSFVRGLLSNRTNRVHSTPMAMSSHHQKSPRPLKKPPLPRPNHEMRYKTISGGSSSSTNLAEMMTHNDHAKAVNAPPPRCSSAEPEELEAAITLACILNRNVPK